MLNPIIYPAWLMQSYLSLLSRSFADISPPLLFGVLPSKIQAPGYHRHQRRVVLVYSSRGAVVSSYPMRPHDSQAVVGATFPLLASCKPFKNH